MRYTSWLLIALTVATLLCAVRPATAEEMTNANTCGMLNDRAVFRQDPQRIACKLLKRAGARILELRKANQLSITKKSNFADLKTKGDCTSQEIIFRGLNKAYPHGRLMGEEKCTGTAELVASLPEKSNVLWILDPIDGTTNYAHGLNHFNISLALVVDGTVCFGAVYAPALKEMFYARKGHGAYLKGPDGKTQRLAVSPVNDFSESLWVTGFKAGTREKVDANLPLAREVAINTHGIRRPGSAALDLAYVAAGRIEGYWELFMDWWDIAAGLLLVEEAGGKTYIIYDRKQQKDDIDYAKPTRAVMASNGMKSVHERMVTILTSEIRKSKRVNTKSGW